ncbi:glycerate kinase, partial [Escherichia coli]|uniref:glycerate kinase n=1 Tax=Escherichia coli TaxID=562 RepID=UPI002557E8C4
TNDGGAGMVQALGAKLCDANGNEIGFGGGSLNTLNDIDIYSSYTMLQKAKTRQFTLAGFR